MNNTVTKKILIDRIADSTGMKRVAVKQVVQEFLDSVIHELGEGNRLEFRDFGVFEVKARAPRIAQNPKTLERVPVPAKRTVKFKVGRRMREAIDRDPNVAASTASAHIEPKSATTTTTTAARIDTQRDVIGSIRGESSERAHETASVR